MMVMTAKVDLKKVLTIIGIAAAVIIAAIVLFGGNDSTATSAPNMSANDARVQFLKDFGWDVTPSPTESSQVRIPGNDTEVYRRYNALQQSQGYDLTPYAGKTAMRYVYRINNYPGATQPVYATVLVYKNQIIGGDITDTAANGQIHGFKMPDSSAPGQTTPTETSQAAGASQ